MGRFERYLSVWVALAIGAGVGLGLAEPWAFAMLARLEWASVNLVVAALIWVMIYPMMLKVDLSCLKDVVKQPRGLGLTLAVNWLIKPFTMAGLGVLCFQGLYPALLPASMQPLLSASGEYIAGMILLGVAPCTAMVFVWSHLVQGDANYTLVQVSINDLIMVVAFAPLAGLLLGVTELVVPWQTLIASVVIFVVLPLGAGVATQRALGAERLARLARRLKPASMVGLLLTVVLLFGFQAQTLLSRPLAVLLVALPLIAQSYGVFAIAYAMARALKLPFQVAAPAAMIGTSNFFELAVAVAISLFGLQSGAALATVVGVLIEVPVMLSLVALANRTRAWFPESAAQPRGA